ncbi:hypothetical protein [Morganella morganii]|uniref:hypothetical protein n=1 Tax=Morganella morganii TaxID=582 RepID=UPI002A5224C8|nr:hypothetical protein [Morganella morganii]
MHYNAPQRFIPALFILRKIRLRNAGYVSKPAETHPGIPAYLLKDVQADYYQQTDTICGEYPANYSGNTDDELVCLVAVLSCSDQYFAANCDEMFIMSPFFCKN